MTARTASDLRAFTLLELMLVLAIVALVAGSAALSLRGPYRAVQLENALECAALVDNQIRDVACRTARPARLVIRLDSGTIAAEQSGNGLSAQETLRMPVAGMDLVLVDGRRIDGGQTCIAVSSRGRTSSYALRFRTPEGGHRYLVFLGLSGEALRIDDERELEILARLQPRPDAP